MASAKEGASAFLRMKLIRVELPDDLKSGDPAVEPHCAVNVKERTVIDGINHIHMYSSSSPYVIARGCLAWCRRNELSTPAGTNASTRTPTREGRCR